MGFFLGGAIILTCLGALCYWGAGALGEESCYFPAAVLLLLALLAAALAGLG
jgi:hypothetical protein